MQIQIHGHRPVTRHVAGSVEADCPAEFPDTNLLLYGERSEKTTTQKINRFSCRACGINSIVLSCVVIIANMKYRPTPSSRECVPYTLIIFTECLIRSSPVHHHENAVYHSVMPSRVRPQQSRIWTSAGCIHDYISVIDRGQNRCWFVPTSVQLILRTTLAEYLSTIGIDGTDTAACLLFK